MSKRQIFIFFVFLVLPVTLLALKPEGKLQVANHVASVLLYPIKAITSYMQFLGVTKQRIEDLEREIELLKFKNAEIKKYLKLNGQELKGSEFELVKSQIIGRDPGNINGYLTINKGSIHGLRVNQAVICVDGLVGRIKHAGDKESLVETVENNSFSVSALDTKTDVHGMVKRLKKLQFEYIRKDDGVFINDTIITSGMSDIFPPGIVIGFISRIEMKPDLFFKNIYLEPAAAVNRLYYVYVIVPKSEDRSINPP